MKFDFCTKEHKQGSEIVDCNTLYNKTLGYGFEDSTWVEPEDTDIPSKVNETKQGASYVTDEKDCCSIANETWIENKNNDGFITTFKYVNTSVFSVDLEPANYTVNVEIATANENLPINLTAQNIAKFSDVKLEGNDFIVKTYTIALIEHKLQLQFEGSPIKLRSIEIIRQQEKEASAIPTIYIASDSTVQSYKQDKMPQGGWGQMLPNYFSEDVLIKNKAIGGRSSKSFIAEGRFDEILNEIKPKDYLLIQWGHNDATAIRPARYVHPKDYENYLQKYIDGAKQRGAIPVFVTPVPMRIFDEKTGVFDISFKPYREVMLKMAKEQNIPLIDNGKVAAEYLTNLGVEASKAVFLFLPKGFYEAYPAGSTDRAHYQSFGANQMARLIAEQIKGNDRLSQLAKYLVEIKIPEAVPQTPSNLSLAQNNNLNITMTWDKVEAELYYIYRKINDGTFEKYAASPIHLYTDTACEEGTKYTYRVYASNAKGLSETSNEIDVVAKKHNFKFSFGVMNDAYINVTKQYNKALGYGLEDENSFVLDLSSGEYLIKVISHTNEQSEFKMSVLDKLVLEKTSYKAVEVIPLLLAPTGLRFYEKNLDTTPPTVVLTWMAAEDAVSYNVYRKSDKETEYKFLFNQTDLTYYEESAQLGLVYHYYVTAVTADHKESLQSNNVEVAMIK
jgi:lysophospholipase L1-like esterase